VVVDSLDTPPLKPIFPLAVLTHADAFRAFILALSFFCIQWFSFSVFVDPPFFFFIFFALKWLHVSAGLFFEKSFSDLESVLFSTFSKIGRHILCSKD